MSAPLDMDAIEARTNAATAGPWRECGHDRDVCQCCAVWSTTADVPVAVSAPAVVVDFGDCYPGMTEAKANAVFVAAARTDVPALIARIRELEAELAAARALLAVDHGAIAESDRLGFAPCCSGGG